jgi:hypothetical protein
MQGDETMKYTRAYILTQTVYSMLAKKGETRKVGIRRVPRSYLICKKCEKPLHVGDRVIRTSRFRFHAECYEGSAI